MQFTRLMKVWLNNGATLSVVQWLPTPMRLYDDVPLVRLEEYKGCLIFMTLAGSVPRVLRVDEDTFKRDDFRLRGQGMCGGSPVDFNIDGTMLEQDREAWESWFENTEVYFEHVAEGIAYRKRAIDNGEYALHKGESGSWSVMIDSVRVEGATFFPTGMLLFKMSRGKAVSGEAIPIPGMTNYLRDYERMFIGNNANDVLEYLEERQQNQSGQYRALSEKIDFDGPRLKWHVVRQVFTEQGWLAL